MLHQVQQKKFDEPSCIYNHAYSGLDILIMALSRTAKYIFFMLQGFSRMVNSALCVNYDQSQNLNVVLAFGTTVCSYMARLYGQQFVTIGQLPSFGTLMKVMNLAVLSCNFSRIVAVLQQKKM